MMGGVGPAGGGTQASLAWWEVGVPHHRGCALSCKAEAENHQLVSPVTTHISCAPVSSLLSCIAPFLVLPCACRAPRSLCRSRRPALRCGRDMVSLHAEEPHARMMLSYVRA